MSSKYLALMVLLLLPLASAQSVTLTTSASVTPSQISSGESGTMDIAFKNIGSTYASNIRLTIFSSEILDFKQTSFSLGNLEAGSSKTISVPITVKSSITGTTSVRVSVKYGIGSGADTTEELSVPVAIGGAVILRVSNITYGAAIPGKAIDFSLDVENVGKGSAANIKVELALSGLPFVPVEGDVIEYIPLIKAGSSKTVSFKLQVAKGSDIKAYSLPVALSFEDASGKAYNATRIIGVKLSGKADIIVLVDKKPVAGPNAKATIAIANRGDMTAEFLTAHFESPYGSKTSYIGKLDPDDYETIDVDQVMPSPSYKMSVAIIYKDSYSNEVEEKSEIEISTIQIQKDYTVFIVLIILAVFLALRHKKIIKI